MYMIYCEWDIGQEWTVFSTKEVAKDWAVRQLKRVGVENDLEDLENEGLIGYEKVVWVDG